MEKVRPCSCFAPAAIALRDGGPCRPPNPDGPQLQSSGAEIGSFLQQQSPLLPDTQVLAVPSSAERKERSSPVTVRLQSRFSLTRTSPGQASSKAGRASLPTRQPTRIPPPVMDFIMQPSNELIARKQYYLGMPSSVKRLYAVQPLQPTSRQQLIQ